MAIRYFLEDDGDEIDVHALSTKPVFNDSENVRHASGRVTVKKSKEVPNFAGGRVSPKFYGYSDHVVVEDRPDNMPTELFTHHPPHIRRAYADGRIRHTAPMMVALALNRMGAQHTTPQVDDSLTVYSSALSQAAAQRGMVTGHPNNPDMKRRNGGPEKVYSHIPQRTLPHSAIERMSTEYSEASPTEIRQAKDLLRRRLGRPEPVAKRGQSQFEQLSLDL